MGMYDMLGNGENQIKCFDINWPTENGGFGCSGGSLRFYGPNEEVPWQSWSYNYGRNFIIIDASNFYDSTVHFIEDGKYKFSLSEYKLATATNDITNFTTIIDKQGNKLKNIHCIKDIKQYIDNINSYYKQYFEYSHNPQFIKIRSDFLQSIRLDTMCNYTKEERIKLKQDYLNVENQVDNYQDQLWQTLVATYENKNIGVDNQLINFGIHLECLSYILKNSRSILLPLYINKINLLLNKNPELLNDYINWSKTGPADWQQEVQDIVNYINNGRDNA